MVGQAIRAIAGISRLDTSLLVFLTLFVPLCLRGEDILAALAESLPILAISMCGFILNDIHDAERDLENHPGRPLPRKQLTETQAAVLYFLLLGISLATLRIYVDPATTILYLLLLIALINYSYIVTYFAYLKNLYVACVGTLPLLILSRLLQNNIMTTTMGALFLFLLGRELLMDIPDFRGDGKTIAKRLGVTWASVGGFSLKLAGDGTLAAFAPTASTLGCALAMLLLDLAFALMWYRPTLRRVIVHAMKAQLLLGIAYIALS